MRRGLFAIFFLFIAMLSVQAQAQHRYPIILVPATDKSGRAIEAQEYQGEKYPVLKLATESALLQNLRAVLATPFLQQELALAEYARNQRINELNLPIKKIGDAHRSLFEPLYLLLSKQEGGFARQGFWLEASASERKFINAAFVDMVVDERSVKSGEFEEIFAHELGHVILSYLFGGLPAGNSRKMHASFVTTDYPTAFNEGYAEHFQPLVRDNTTNENLRRVESGVDLTNLNRFWFSKIDSWLRNQGVRRNIFVHNKLLPQSAFDEGTDLYQLFIDEETSPYFSFESIKNAQQMMASEGVIATLFFRLVNDERLRNRYREGAFYSRFFTDKSPVTDAAKQFTPYQNVMLKLFAAMNEMNRQTLTGDRAMLLETVKNYGKIFPDEKAAVYEVFINTTFGATISNTMVRSLEEYAKLGRRGSMQFVERLPATRKQMQELIDKAVRDEVALDAELGKQLWLLNDGFTIGRTIFNEERTLPLTINLNTASFAELRTLPDVDFSVARAILAARAVKGYFKNLEEFREIKGVSPSLIEKLKKMQSAMTAAGKMNRS
ncbi:MAG: helix-hairpin-helix domain-containing protein [Acidobacteriota bacterium]